MNEDSLANAKFGIGDAVQWTWRGFLIEGVVEEIYFHPVVKTIKGKRIKRNGSPTKAAYMVRSEAGNIALKLESELEQRQKVFANTSDGRVRA